MTLLAYEVFASDMMLVCIFFFFQAEDGRRDLVRSRGLGDLYKRQESPDAVLGARRQWMTV